ncbi:MULTISPECIES: hypothetical protein [unclassified Streptomyces]|uniref:hypothetical protein n=1 Tax=unclassified Streptomyces TaxID=2593676 RepID=UPI0036F60196
MFRTVRDTLARLLARPRPGGPAANGPAQEVRAPDPCVRRLPDPHDARWRRWSKRCRAAGRYLPFPAEEACWHVPSRPPPPSWHTDDDVVRPYVGRVPDAESRRAPMPYAGGSDVSG